jgi:hypothetical protein
VASDTRWSVGALPLSVSVCVGGDRISAVFEMWIWSTTLHLLSLVIHEMQMMPAIIWMERTLKELVWLLSLPVGDQEDLEVHGSL